MGNDSSFSVLVTTIISHGSLSTSPAFSLNIEVEVPSVLIVTLPYLLRVGDLLMQLEEAEVLWTLAWSRTAPPWHTRSDTLGATAPPIFGSKENLMDSS